MKHVLRVAGCLAVVSSAWLVACGSDSTPISTSPQVPPAIEIVSVTSVGGPTWTPGADACVEVGRDADKTVVVLVALDEKNFPLRPPGTCGSARQCGTVVLRVDPKADGELFRLQAAQKTLPVPFAALPLGQHTFHVELLGKTGKPVKDPDGGGEPLFAEVTLEVKDWGGCGGEVDAGDAGDAGQDASDAGTDADADADTDAASDAGDAADDADGGGLDAADAADAADADDASVDATDAGTDAADGSSD